MLVSLLGFGIGLEGVLILVKAPFDPQKKNE